MICNMLIVSAADFITWVWCSHVMVVTWYLSLLESNNLVVPLSLVNNEYSMVIITGRGSRLGHGIVAKMIIINISQNGSCVGVYG